MQTPRKTILSRQIRDTRILKGLCVHCGDKLKPVVSCRPCNRKRAKRAKLKGWKNQRSDNEHYH